MSCSSNSLEPTLTVTPFSASGSTEPALTSAHGPPAASVESPLREPQPLRVAARPSAAMPATQRAGFFLDMVIRGSPSGSTWMAEAGGRARSSDAAWRRRALQHTADPVEQEGQAGDHDR